MRARFQAFDHRPAEHVAISETGNVQLSGTLGFDPATRQVLVIDPRLDTLTFDRKSATTEKLERTLMKSWEALVGNPVRAGLPAHPLLGTLKDYVTDLSYDGETILLIVGL